MTQQQLLDNPTPIARNTDPPTSHTGPTNRQRDARTVLQLIHRHPGCTASELTRILMVNEIERATETLPHGATPAAVLTFMFDPAHPGLSPTRCSQLPNKRVPDLHGAGLIAPTVPRVCGVTGKPARSWMTTDLGAAALANCSEITTPTKGNA